ncbi:hypothetical protein NOF04DRAFT_1281920 [Fusarium oxysporum II5]|nr:hypothetical protein NOF04DRAFT_1281920 [Fusarium oxysporum II5]
MLLAPLIDASGGNEKHELQNARCYWEVMQPYVDLRYSRHWGSYPSMQEAQSIVETVDVFQNSTVLLEKETWAGLASEAALSIAKLLLAAISPIIHVCTYRLLLLRLDLFVSVLSWWGVLGREAEETIMEVEDWAIDTLDWHQRVALLASYHLQPVIDRIQLQNNHDEHALRLFKARLLQQELQTLVIRKRQNIHE